ncbi:unnamed protein product, partial [Polarella glacialis]
MSLGMLFRNPCRASLQAPAVPNSPGLPTASSSSSGLCLRHGESSSVHVTSPSILLLILGPPCAHQRAMRRRVARRCRWHRLRRSAAMTGLCCIARQSEGGLVQRQKMELDIVEAAVTDIVPKISVIQQQAEMLREEELKQVLDTLEERGGGELTGVFSE